MQSSQLLKVQLSCLKYIQSFQVCVAFAVIISIITATCVLGGKWRGFDRASGIMHVFFVISLYNTRKWWREFNNHLLSINWFRSINKVKGLRMERNVDMRRISLVELQTLVSLGIWSSVHKVWLHDSLLSHQTQLKLKRTKSQPLQQQTLWSAECASLFNVLAFQFCIHY